MGTRPEAGFGRGRCRPARTPGGVGRGPLLGSMEAWVRWFRGAGLDVAEPSGGVMYEDLSMLIRSAIDGDGVALVRHAIVLQELAEGRLVRLFETFSPSADSYYLVSPPAVADRPAVRAFRSWLGEEVAAFQARHALLT